MRIDHGTPSEHGSFTVEATEGRRLVDVFRDAETGLLVVEEEVEGDSGDRTKLTITLEPTTGELIPVDARARRIDYGEHRTPDDATQLILHTVRRVDATTGAETIEETLQKADGTDAGRTTRMAFARTKPPTLLEDYKRRRDEMAAAERRFWTTQYAAMDFAARAAHWAGRMFRHMRWQNESGLDPYAAFDATWVARAKEHEPDFDRMLDFILERYEEEFLYQDTNPAALRRRLGKGSLEE